jgi:hypothetical protein
VVWVSPAAAAGVPEGVGSGAVLTVAVAEVVAVAVAVLPVVEVVRAVGVVRGGGLA